MIIPIILFGISLVLISAMVFLRVWQIETGRFHYDPNTPERKITFDPSNIWHTIINTLKWIGHHIIIIALKSWVVITHLLEVFYEKKIKPLFRKIISKIFGHKENTERDTSPSIFMKTMTEYKTKMKKFRQKIKEENVE